MRVAAALAKTEAKGKAKHRIQRKRRTADDFVADQRAKATAEERAMILEILAGRQTPMGRQRLRSSGGWLRMRSSPGSVMNRRMSIVAGRTRPFRARCS